MGSGISANSPSSLPTGWEFMSELLHTIAPSQNIYAKLSQYADYTKANFLSGAFLRFESLLQRIAEYIDPDLHVLNCLDVGFSKDEHFNTLHIEMVRLLEQGIPVWTTNFDGLIECAAKKMRITIPVLYQPGQFKKQKLWRQKPAPLLKLHGSFRDWRGRSVRQSLKATIAGVGRMVIGLDKAVVASFKQCLRERDLMVSGYSGLDDFDVSNLLATTDSDMKLIWVRHNNSTSIRVYQWQQIKRLFKQEAEKWRTPSREAFILTTLGNQGLRRKEKLILIEGRTDKIFNIFWPRDCEEIKIDKVAGNSLTKYFDEWCEDRELGKPERWLFCGVLFDDLGDLEMAMRCYRKTIKWAQRIRSGKMESAACRNLIAVSTDMEKFSLAKKYAGHLQALEKKAQGSVTALDRAHTANAIGKMYEARASSRQDFVKAETAYKHAMRWAEKAGNRSLLAIASHNLGILFLVKGKTMEAEKWLNHSLRTAQKIGHVAHVADALIGLARVSDRRRKTNQARMMLQQARMLFERLGDFHGEFDAILYYLESVDSGTINDDQLEVLIQRGRTLAEILQTEYYGIILNRAEAEVRRHQKRYDEARQILSHAVKKLNATQRKDTWLLIRTAQGFLEFESGNYTKSTSYFLKADKLSNELNETTIRSDVVYKLAEIFYYRDDYEKALKYVDKAVKLNRQMGDPIWYVDSLLLKAEIIRHLGEHRRALRYSDLAKAHIGLIPKSNVLELQRLQRDLTQLLLRLKNEFM